MFKKLRSKTGEAMIIAMVVVGLVPVVIGLFQKKSNVKKALVRCEELQSGVDCNSAVAGLSRKELSSYVK